MSNVEKDVSKKMLDNGIDPEISRKILSDIVVYSKYARYLPDQKRRESWEEIVWRNAQMHINKFPSFESEILEAYKYVLDRQVLPSMRSLQFGGKPIEISPNRQYNCFDRATRFITNEGVKQFSDFKDGDKIYVPTHVGNIKPAIVKNYGVGRLTKVVFAGLDAQKIIRVTPDHRWLLKDGTETTNLKVGDSILDCPDTVMDNIKNWTVKEITEDGIDELWCLEVEDDHSFILSGGMVTGNCAYMPVDAPAAFNETMFLLLGGTGVGYSVQKHHVERLPEILGPKKRGRRYLVGDSIEGWSDAVKVLVEAYYFNKADPIYDFRDIRPKGSLLVTSGGKAPGPQPLKDCLHNIRKVFDRALERGIGTQLTTLEVHDIICYIADAVLAGGIRRAALISLFSFDDEDMLTCKFGNWWELNPQRARANNSAVAVRHRIRKKDFFEFWEKVKASGCGEPGIYFTNDKEWGANPSLRKGTKVLTTEGIFAIEELQDKEFEVKNLNGKISKARCWLSGKDKPLYKLTLSTGKEYYCTAEHEWPVWDGEKYVKVKTPNLEAGDKLPFLRETSLNLKTPDNISYVEGFFAGWHLGDGWTTIRTDTGERQNGLVVSKEDNKWAITQILESVLTDLFKSNAKFYERESVFELNTTSKAWNDFMDRLGYGHKSEGLPKAVWTNGSERFRQGIINGLFSSDGSVEEDKKRIRFFSSHKKLVDDISDLLGFYGIKSTIKERSTILNDQTFIGYVLSITEGQSIKQFRSIFKLAHGLKQDRLTKYEFRYNIPENNQVEIVSVEPTSLKEDVWDISVYDDTYCFQIAHCITGNCVEIGLRPNQFCVSGATKLITRTGLETIENAVGKSIEIWNGKKWSTVKPYKTGNNDDLYRVELSDGSYLDATANHKFLARKNWETDFKEYETLELINLLEKYGRVVQVPTSSISGCGGEHNDNAYEYGLFVGEGCIDGKQLYAFIFNGNKYEKIKFDTLDYEFSVKLKIESIADVFAWNEESILRFIAGWVDANGSVAGNTYMIYGNERNIRDAQLLLTKVGISSSINSTQADIEAIVGTRKTAVWYLQINNASRIPSRKFELSDKNVLCKEKYRVIQSIRKLEGKHKSYCLTENELHQCVFNNILTKQCNLTTVNVSDVESQEDLNNRVRAAARIATLQATYTDFHYLRDIWKKTTEKEALIGVSMTGIASGAVLKLNLEEAANVVKEENQRVAKILGIKPAARTTCIKPEGCQKKETIVSTKDGILSLEEIGDIESNEIWQEHDFKVYTDRGEKQSTKFFKNGLAKTKKILTDGGIELESTHNHMYRVLTEEGSYEWKRADELEEGMMLPYSVGEYNGGSIQVLRQVTPVHPNQKIIRQPSTISNDLAWFIGLYFGNGSNHKRGIRIHGNFNEQKGFDKLKEVVNNLFDLQTQLHRHTAKDGRCSVYINSTMLLSYLAANGILKEKSDKINIPELIRRSPKDIIESFIDGYATANGCSKSDKGRSFCTISKTMAEQLTVVLRAIGHDCKMRLMPPTESSFGTKMRFWIQERKGRLANPLKIRKYMMDAYCDLSEKGFDNLSVDTIVSISDGECDTYDIEINDESHTYLANSYISHNTASLVVGSSPGIHAWHSPYYIRRMRLGKNEAIYKYLKKVIPDLLEDELLKPELEAVLSVPIKAPEGSIFRTETAIDLLERGKLFSTKWITPGHTSGANKHNVSITVSVKDHEWDEVGEWMWENRKLYNGIAVLPYDGGNYVQKPYEECTKEQYEALLEKCHAIDLKEVIEEEDYTSLKEQVACSNGACTVTKV